MAVMLVTLVVSKLSDWLNADAPCRESKEGHTGVGQVVRGAGNGGARAGEGSPADSG